MHFERDHKEKEKLVKPLWSDGAEFRDGVALWRADHLLFNSVWLNLISLKLETFETAPEH